MDNKQQGKKKFRDYFIVPEENNASPAPVEPSIKKEVFTAPVQMPTPHQGVTREENPASITVYANDEIVTQVWDQIIARNLPGPDYLELRNNAAALQGLPLTEEQRLEAGFKVLKNTYPNLTKETILKSIDTYVGITKEEKEAGLEQCRAARAANVGEKENRLKVMKETIEEITSQMNELKKRYDDTKANIDKMEHDILTATQEMDVREKAFLASIESVLAVLTSDKNKIATLNF